MRTLIRRARRRGAVTGAAGARVNRPLTAVSALFASPLPHDLADAFERERTAIVFAGEHHGHAERFARADHRPELEGPHLAEHHSTAAARTDQPPRRLHHRFDHHHAWEDGERREVIGQVLLGERHLLDHHNPVLQVLKYAVNQVKLHGERA